MTDDLIARLSSELHPTDLHAVIKRLGLAVVVGGSAAFIGMLLLLGLRPDFPQALGSQMFWFKAAYTISFGGVGLWTVERLARPGGDGRTRLHWLVAPFAVIVALAALQLAAAPEETRRSLVMGSSAAVCSWRIGACAAPLFVALMWAVRGLAPTRLRLAGAIAGLTAGGLGAGVYSLHCPEVGAPFVAIWYSLGMIAPATLGALIGHRLLRW